MKRVAIVQSNYIPWKGYFDLIGLADEFILLDSVQYTRRDWRNRNRIKTPSGSAWLSIPVETRGRYDQTIAETRVAGSDWAAAHWSRIRQSYRVAPGFAAFGGAVEALYRAPELARMTRLSEVNRYFLSALCGLLGIGTPLRWDTDYELVEGKTERLVELCRQAGATEYLSGPAARAYLDEAAFEAAGIGVAWMDYSGYPEYRQPFPPFEHGVSIIDLLLCEGRDAPRYLKSLA